MKKKRMILDKRKSLALNSIDYLFRMSKENPKYSNILIRHAISYKKRHRISFSWSQKRSYCNKCLKIYGGNEKVRATKSGLRIICPYCNHIRMLKHSK